METSISYDEAKTYSGWLEKKSPNALGGYQKRFFRILGGQVILYGNKEKDKNPKGQIPIGAIKSVTKKEEKKFHLELEGNERSFKLKAKTEQERDKWVSVIELLMTKVEKEVIISSPKKKFEKVDKDLKSASPLKLGKLNKMKETDKTILELLRNAGIDENEDTQNNKLYLQNKKINELIDLTDPLMQKRLYTGFVYKKKKKTNTFYKGWLVLFSSRPLRDDDYEDDEITLDKELKGWLKYDVLFIFKKKGETDSSTPKHALFLEDCHTIKCEDTEKKYYITMEIGDEIHVFYTEVRGDRDIWFEVLKNSRQTAKEISSSVTKKPRNMRKLIGIYEEEGVEKYIAELQNEKLAKLGEYFNISDIDNLIFILGEYKEMVNPILDGCLLYYKDDQELFKITYDNLAETYMKIVTTFWTNNHSKISNESIMRLANTFFNFMENAEKFKIEDVNMKKNGNELVKIYIKNIYRDIIDAIQKILKREREIKNWDDFKGELKTEGPKELFTIYNEVVNTNKNLKIAYIHTYILNMLYEGIIQFLIGIDCISSNYKIKVEQKYLVTISNNTLVILTLLQEFIKNYKDCCVLSESRINEEIHSKSIINALELLRENTIMRFVIESSKPLADSFNCYFYLLDLEKILEVTTNIYSKFSNCMNLIVKKRTWEEILKLTVYYYMKLLIISPNKGIKNAEDLIDKLNKHRIALKDAYYPIIGNAVVDANLKVFDDLISFLRVDSTLISQSVIPLRKFCGTVFNLEVVGKLLSYRVDLTNEQITDTINSCRKVLVKMSGSRKSAVCNDNPGFFDVMEAKTVRRVSVKKRMDKRKSEAAKRRSMISVAKQDIENTKNVIKEEEKENESSNDSDTDSAVNSRKNSEMTDKKNNNQEDNTKNNSKQNENNSNEEENSTKNSIQENKEQEKNSENEDKKNNEEDAEPQISTAYEEYRTRNQSEDGELVSDLANKIFKYENFTFDEDMENNEQEKKEKPKERRGKKNSIIVIDDQVSDVLMEGYLYKKSYPRYHKRYFQLKNNALYWFAEKWSAKLSNKIPLKNIISVESESEEKFVIYYDEENEKESGRREIKLKTDGDEEMKNKWMKAITDELDKIKGKDSKSDFYYKPEEKKKAIKDYLKLPDIGTERSKIKLLIAQQIKNENSENASQPKRASIMSTNSSNMGDEENNVIEIREVKATLFKMESKNIDEDYDAHNALFNQGQLKEFSIGLEEKQKDGIEEVKNKDESSVGCCQSFWGTICGIFSKKEENKADIKDGKK